MQNNDTSGTQKYYNSK